jgi:hypothetical protein
LYHNKERKEVGGVGGEERQGGQGREEQKFFPIITCQNKFDELLVFVTIDS